MGPCHCVIVLSVEKMRTRGSPLNRFFWNGQVWASFRGGQMQCMWGRFDEKGNHGSWHSAEDNNSIICMAWRRINISYSHPRDWNIQVWRGQVKKEIKVRVSGISLVTSMRFMENKWRTEVNFCSYCQLFKNLSILKCIQAENPWKKKINR